LTMWPIFLVPSSLLRMCSALSLTNLSIAPVNLLWWLVRFSMAGSNAATVNPIQCH
jgi:hypothetical protein